MRTMPFNFEIEKLLPFGILLRASYVHDRDKFINFSPIYKDGHLEEYDKRYQMVDNCINPKSLTVRMKNCTVAQVKQFDLAGEYLDKVERYTNMAGDKVPVSKKDLEISYLREKCHNHNAAFVSEGLKTIKKLLAPHLAVLEPLGYTKEIQAQGDALVSNLVANKTAYNEMLDERMNLVYSNIELVENFWNFMNDIMKTGKTIYKKDPVKVKEYTQTEILSRLEHTIGEGKDKNNGGTAK